MNEVKRRPGPNSVAVVPKTAHTVTRVSSVSNMLEGALKTLQEQLDELALKSRTRTFEVQDAKILQGYVKSLVDLSKEERERAKDEAGDLGKLSTDELIELAMDKLKTIK